jgi:hypothetical protein
LGDVHGWPDNHNADRLLAWSWTAAVRHLVVVNLSADPADGMADWPWPDDAGRRLVLTDRLTGERYERDGDDVVGNGVYVSVPGHGAHLFSVTR